jgi:hypothetical protein
MFGLPELVVIAYLAVIVGVGWLILQKVIALIRPSPFASRHCPHCGKRIPDVGSFCPICGQKIV